MRALVCLCLACAAFCVMVMLHGCAGSELSNRSVLSARPGVTQEEFIRWTQSSPQ